MNQELLSMALATARESAVLLEGKLNSQASDLYETQLKEAARRKIEQSVVPPFIQVPPKMRVEFDEATSIQTIVPLAEKVSEKTIEDYLPKSEGAVGGPVGPRKADGSYQVMDYVNPGSIRVVNGRTFIASPSLSGGFAAMWSLCYVEQFPK